MASIRWTRRERPSYSICRLLSSLDRDSFHRDSVLRDITDSRKKAQSEYRSELSFPEGIACATSQVDERPTKFRGDESPSTVEGARPGHSSALRATTGRRSQEV